MSDKILKMYIYFGGEVYLLIENILILLQAFDFCVMQINLKLKNYLSNTDHEEYSYIFVKLKCIFIKKRIENSRKSIMI